MYAQSLCRRNGSLHKRAQGEIYIECERKKESRVVSSSLLQNSRRDGLAGSGSSKESVTWD